MPLFVLSFLFGDAILQSLSYLPSLGVVMAFVCLSGVVLFYQSAARIFSVTCFGFLLGFCYAAIIAHHTVSWHLPDEVESKPYTVTGVVASLPEIKFKQTEFLFKLQPSHALVQLTWPHLNAPIHVGDQWQLQVKLKKIHGLQNEAGFDADAWSYQRGLRAKGYVIPYANNIKQEHHWYSMPLEQLRESFRDHLIKALPATPTAHWLLALTVGERTDAKPEEWTVLQQTGTNHLMAVGGLHIGMLCMLVLLLTKKRGYLVALFAAFVYSALAGFSLPTERALLMLIFFTLYTYLQYQVDRWHIWSLALFCTLLLHPSSVLDQSFWLSFGTIAIIIYSATETSVSGWWQKWGRVQYVIAIGLIPLSILFYQEFSLVSLLANILAIPLLEFCILPFCFIATLFVTFAPYIAHLFLTIADMFMKLLWEYLNWLSQYHFAVIHISIAYPLILLSLIIAVAILLTPKQIKYRWLGIIFLLPLFFFKPARPHQGDAWVTVLDAGQGLSVVVETKTHTLLFDTGPSENAIALPYLRQHQINRLDAMIVSHGDMDHRAGVNQLVASLPIHTIYTSAPEKIKVSSQLCLSHASWRWDNVTFSFLYPDNENLQLGNNSSCVLKITTQYNKTVLLPGDIESLAESKIVKQQTVQLLSDILIAPHHGSRTSIYPDFISAVHPSYVVYATGYRNRYHFPHQPVTALYSALHTIQFNTVDEGEIQFKLEKNKIITNRYRKEHPRFYL